MKYRMRTNNHNIVLFFAKLWMVTSATVTQDYPVNSLSFRSKMADNTLGCYVKGNIMIYTVQLI